MNNSLKSTIENYRQLESGVGLARHTSKTKIWLAIGERNRYFHNERWVNTWSDIFRIASEVLSEGESHE